MARLGILFAVVMLPFFALLPSCGTSQPDGNMNSSNSNSNNNSNNNSNANGPFTLKVIARRTPSISGFEISTVRVVGFVNKGRLERDQLEGLAFEFRASDDPGSASPANLQVAKGDEVTLIADEFFSPGLQVNTTPDPFTAPSFTSIPPQFDRWDGAEFATAGADKGVLHFTMDQDRTIEAVFIESNLLSVRCDDPGNGTGTLMDLEIESQPLTIPPVVPGNASNINIVGSIPGQSALGMFGFFNDGSVITLTIPMSRPFTSWSGGEVSGRTVTVRFEELSVPQRVNVVLTY